jgi:protein-S-isoprenylcysteine O-methyltransferase Ste14
MSTQADTVVCVWRSLLTACVAVLTLVTSTGAIVGWIDSSQSLQTTAATAAQAAGVALLGYLLLTFLLFGPATWWPWERIVFLSGLFLIIGAIYLLVLPWRETPLQWIGIAAIAGSVVLVLSFWKESYEDRHKTCPDCAEIVKRQANVCRHCGYRFGEPRTL